MVSKRNNGVTKRQFVFLLIIAGVIFGLIFLFSLSPALSEWYMRIVYPVVATVLSFVSGIFPFSLYDLFLIVAVLLLLKLIVFAVVRKTSFMRFLYLLIRFVTIIVAWFYFSWGIAYFREDFYERSDVPELAFDPEVFKEFAVRFIEETNRFYTGGTDRFNAAGTIYPDTNVLIRIDTDSPDTNRLGTDRLGTDSFGKNRLDTNSLGTDSLGTDRLGTDRLGTDRFGTDRLGTGSTEYLKSSSRGNLETEGAFSRIVEDDTDKEEVRRKIELSYRQLQELLKISYPNGKRRVKPMMFERVYTKMGVSGYFGPFFNETHVNNYSLDFTYPFTVAHEMAHQFGVAIESEANLYAFLVCSRSNDTKIRYSAYASTLPYVLNDVRRFLPDEYKTMVSSIRREIIADLQRNREHWLGVRNESLSAVQDKVYDAYLKTNKISSGQANYSEVVGLLVSSSDFF